MSVKSNNKPIRVMTIVGARPQFIKAAMLSRALMKKGNCEEIMVHTGQHYDEEMSKVFFEEMGLPKPQVNLQIGSGQHGQQTGRMLEQLEIVMLDISPDWVVVYGDTNSTLAGALAAAKLHIPVAHVEAGLRSFNRKMPEEINRILVDQISSILFTPTQQADDHLKRENFDSTMVHRVGDVMFDAVRFFSSDLNQATFSVPPKPYVLATIHRAENTDDVEKLRAIIEGLEDVAKELEVIWPVHPRTQSAMFNAGIYPKVSTRSPVGYLEMLALMKSAEIIVTDSGGVQKEAFFIGVPCVTVRTETEWVELLEVGWNHLANPSDSSSIPNAIKKMLGVGKSLASPNLYGDGNAAEKMADILINF